MNRVANLGSIIGTIIGLGSGWTVGIPGDFIVDSGGILAAFAGHSF